MLAFEIGRQFLFIGLVDGMAYALLALGVILIYRTSRVINFAVASTGVLSAQVMAQLVIRYDTPYWLAFVVAVATGAVFLGVAELIVVRRLFKAPRVVLLVATIGLAQLAQAIVFALPDPTSEEQREDFPTPLAREFEWFGIRIEGGELVLFVMSALVIAGLWLWLQKSMWGRAIRASAAEPDRARLAAIDPGLLSTVVWALTGAFAGYATVLLEAGDRPFILNNPGASLMTRVLVVAVIASFTSFPRAVVAGLAMGVVEALVRVNYPADLGRFDLLLLIVAIVAVFLTSRRDTSRARESFSFAPRVRPIPPALRDIWWVKHHTRIIGAIGIAAAIMLPLLLTRSSQTFLHSRMLIIAVIALSLVVLTGWAGQISLGQGAFAGLGALITSALVLGRDLGIGIGGFDFTLPLPEVHFLAAVVWATLATAVVAILLGLGALRVKGLLLAVITLAFAVAAEKFIFRIPFLSGGSTSSTSLPRAEIGPFDLAPQRTYYYLCLAALVVVVLLVAHLRRTGVGRRIIAVRENPEGAAAATIWPTREKVLAFGLSGGIAGFGGALLGGLVTTVLFQLFTFETSVEVLSAAVIGGVGSVAGPILGSLWVIGLPAFWPDNQVVGLLSSSVGLLILLMYAPGGFVQLWYMARDAFLGWLAERRETTAVERPPAVPVQAEIGPPPAELALRATGVSVTFGARLAVHDVDLDVHHGEIVGLIGTNGAGKSTFMNAVGGFVPAEGTVEIYGTDVTGKLPHSRHALHLGRTFQAATLFPDLTVRETIQVALEAQEPTRFLPTSLVLPSSRAHERRQLGAADDLISFLGLGDYTNAFIAELSTGTRRIVELCCLLAVGARLLCLDEPTAGVAQREAEALIPLLTGIRRELDASVLLIEHDMPMVMALSDRIYCLEAGSTIAEGEPEQVRNDPRVVSSYLGTDERSIARSGAAE